MNRIGFLGGSDANILMSGDPLAIHDLWLVKTGKKGPNDLSRVLPVQMGICTEPLNRTWFTYATGRTVMYAGEVRTHPECPWMTCTLDGVCDTDAGDVAVFEAKHVHASSKIDEVAQKYMPQLHHNMLVTGYRFAVLSVFIGMLAYERVEVPFTDWYAEQLVAREKAFWACVEFGTPPEGMPEVVPPVPPACEQGEGRL